jgi:cytosine/adenosine deaminase-related metal-dependent hydrolase
MFMNGSGEMFEWLRRNERDMSDCGVGSPVQHLERCRALSKNLLAVHVNFLAARDASLLARKKASVVHCPRSHFYFRHQKFPLRELTRARVNVCLGTDSLATVYKKPKEPVELNMFDEMRSFARAHSRLPPEKILRLATLNGALALGLDRKIGRLSKGAFADLITIPFAGNAADAYEAVLDHHRDVSASMIDGNWAVEPAPQ